MTSMMLAPDERAAAFAVAREIGDTFRAVRERRGDTWADVANAIGMPHASVCRFERGEQHNLKLGNATRMLALYGLKLAVVPINDTEIPQ